MTIQLDDNSPLAPAAQALDALTQQLAASNASVASLQAANATLQSQIPQVWEINADKMISAALWSLRLRYPPYVWGLTYAQNKSFDCSSFMQELHAFVNIHIPRTSNQQSNSGTPVVYENMRKGDLIFFQLDSDAAIDHVGMYIGNSQFIQTNTPETGINIASIAVGSDWYKRMQKITRYT